MATRKAIQIASNSKENTDTKRQKKIRKTYYKRPTRQEGPRPDKPTPEKAKKKIGLQLNWNRAIHIDTTIDEALLKNAHSHDIKAKTREYRPHYNRHR